MSNVFALLLDDALLNICAVTEVVLFSIVAFISHGSLATNWGVVGSLFALLLQMFSWFWQWNKFEHHYISQYLTKLRRTKHNVSVFWATLYAVLQMSRSFDVQINARRIMLLHDGPFRWVWRLHEELESSTLAVVRGPEGPLNGRHPSWTYLGTISSLTPSGLAQGKRETRRCSV